MDKSKKIWLGASVILFLTPEIFFSFVLSFVFFILRLGNPIFLYKYFISEQFFIDNPVYLFIALAIEFLGAIGLFVWNIKFNKSRFKLFFSVITFLLVLSLVFIFLAGYAISNMSFP